MTQRILIMGLPGAGKTFMARALQQLLSSFQHEGHGIRVEWFNADDVRKKFNDWSQDARTGRCQ